MQEADVWFLAYMSTCLAGLFASMHVDIAKVNIQNNPEPIEIKRSK